jgi:hypothetical protein
VVLRALMFRIVWILWVMKCFAFLWQLSDTAVDLPQHYVLLQPGSICNSCW